MLYPSLKVGQSLPHARGGVSTKDLTIKGRFYDILDEERALDNPDERAFYRTALEYRQRLFSPRQQEILVQTARAKFGLAV